MTDFGKEMLKFSPGNAGLPPPPAGDEMLSLSTREWAGVRGKVSDVRPRPRLWQRQPEECAADFNAFVAYLRLKGRRSLRVLANETHRPLSNLRRLSARFNWPARVHAFEERLADAKQNALDSAVHNAEKSEKSRLEQLRLDEFLLATDVLAASKRWLALASNPRRRLVPLSQILRLIELATRLARIATGMPLDESKTPAQPPPAQGYYSAEEALQKIYGSPLPEEAPADAPSAPVISSASQVAAPKPETPTSPPPPKDTKRDLVPHALVIGSHGFLCLQPIEEV